MTDIRPSAGKDVDFEIDGENAVEVYILSVDTIDNINASMLKPSVEKIKKSKIPRILRNIIIFGVWCFIFSAVIWYK